MHLHLIAAEAPKVTEWWIAGVTTLSLLATIGIGVGVGVYANGYRMRIRAVCDERNVVQVTILNTGRISGEIGPVEFVVRPVRSVRLIRWLARKPVCDEVIGTADPAQVKALQPGQSGRWQIAVPDLDMPRLLPPTARRPLSTGSERPIEPSQLQVRVDRSLYRPRFRHYRRTSPFQRRILRVTGNLPPLELPEPQNADVPSPPTCSASTPPRQPGDTHNPKEARPTTSPPTPQQDRDDAS